MAKKDLRKGMLSSMQAEERATEDRFERAESLFAKPPQPKVAPRRVPSVRSDDKAVLQTFSVRPSDLDLIEELKMRCVEAAISSGAQEAKRQALATNRSDILRIALAALDRLDPNELLDLLASHAKKRAT